MDTLKALKRIFIPSSVFTEITEENLKNQKMEFGMTEYKKWLKKRLAELTAVKIRRQEKLLDIPAVWIEKINLLEKELEKAEKF